MTKQYKPGDKLNRLKELVDYLSESSERRAGSVYCLSHRIVDGFIEYAEDENRADNWAITGLALDDFPFTVLPDAEPEKRYLRDINELEHVTKVRIHWPEWMNTNTTTYFINTDSGWFIEWVRDIELALRNGWPVEVLEAKEAE